MTPTSRVRSLSRRVGPRRRSKREQPVAVMLAMIMGTIREYCIDFSSLQR
jgi:hypothetical protein